MPKKKSTEYVRAFRERQRANKPPKQAPKSSSTRCREYRARKKALLNATRATDPLQDSAMPTVVSPRASQGSSLPTSPQRSIKVDSNDESASLTMDTIVPHSDIAPCESSRKEFRKKNITSESLKEDLYPDPSGGTAAVSAEEWAAGTDAEPILISLRDGCQPSTTKNNFKIQKKTNALGKDGKVDAVGQIVEQPTVVVSEDLLKEFVEEIRKLKAVIVKHESRISVLESAVALQTKEEERNGSRTAGSSEIVYQTK